MAITKSVSRTDTSISVTLSGYSNIPAGSVFTWTLRNGNGYGVSFEKVFTVASDKKDYTLIATGLDPGQEYLSYIELDVSTTSAHYRYPSSGEYGRSDGFYTSGVDPFDVSGITASANAYGTTISASVSGIPKSSKYREFGLFLTKSSGGVPVEYDRKSLSSQYLSSVYLTASGLEEQTEYDVAMNMSFYVANYSASMQTEVVGTIRKVKTGYNTGCGVSVSSLTEKGCTITTWASASTTYPRTIKLYGKEGVNGTREHLQDFYVTSNADYTYSLNTLKPGTYYIFEIEVYVGAEYVSSDSAECTTPAPSGTLVASDATEYSAKLTLSGLATGISYRREVEWYYKASTDSNYTKFPTVSNVIASATSASVTIDLLASNTAYSFKAVILGDGVALGNKTTTISTKETVANISVGATESASVKIIVGGLVNVAYKRTFEWLYKKQDEVDYIKFDETEMSPSDAVTEMTKTFKPLTPATYYNFKVYIKKDGIAMKELLITARTALDNSLVPNTEIEKVEQSIGDKTVKVYWDAPSHELGTYYKIQYSTDDENYVDVGTVMTEPPGAGYTSVELPELNVEYYIRVMSYFELDGEVASKTSEPLSVYMFSAITWDTPKIKGQPFDVTASEWNKVINVVKERLEREDVIVDEYVLDLAVTGKDITAAQFNQILIAVNIFNPHNIELVSDGDAITADLLNLLISKVNLE